MGRLVPVARCRTCGADVAKKKSFALRCHACGGSIAQDAHTEPLDGVVGHACPDALLPFVIDEPAARAAFAKWVSTRRFAPQALVENVPQVRAIDAVFLPFWSFGATRRTEYVGSRGEHRTRMMPRTKVDANGQPSVSMEPEIYTEWTSVAGRIDKHFENVMLPGCSALTGKLPEWPETNLTPYTPQARQGARVLAYDVDPASGFDQVTAAMGKQIEREVRQAIGGADQRINGVSTTYTGQSYALVLLPAWLVTYTHEGETWSALVNGSSGAVAGERPVSGTKIALLAAILLALIAAAIIVPLVLH